MLNNDSDIRKLEILRSNLTKFVLQSSCTNLRLCHWRNKRWKQDWKFFLDCQAPNQIQSNLKSSWFKVQLLIILTINIFQPAHYKLFVSHFYVVFTSLPKLILNWLCEMTPSFNITLLPQTAVIISLSYPSPGQAAEDSCRLCSCGTWLLAWNKKHIVCILLIKVNL